MTLPQVYEQYESWEQKPPAHWLAAAYLKYKPPKRRRHVPADEIKRFEAWAERFKATGKFEPVFLPSHRKRGDLDALTVTGLPI